MKTKIEKKNGSVSAMNDSRRKYFCAGCSMKCVLDNIKILQGDRLECPAGFVLSIGVC